MKRKGCLIPQRELKWKKYDYLRNRENKIFYDCECGSRYVSFPAIFLHFQRKHNRKISTQQLPEECSFRQTQTQSVYMYFLKAKSKQSNSSSVINSQKKSLKKFKFFDSIFSEFIADLKGEEQQKFSHKQAKRITKNFFEFCKENAANEENQERETTSSEDIIENLPYSFNAFVCGQEEAQNDEQTYSKVCNVLFLLSKWLNEKKYSQLTVEMSLD